MRTVKYLVVVLVIFLNVILGACSNSHTQTAISPPNTSQSLFPLIVNDSNGNDVVIEEPPQRIIAFDSAAVEILFTIGESHRIVGTHSFVTYPPETETIPRVGDAFNMNFEKIVELQPDLIYVFFDRFLQDLEKLGLKVLYINSLDHNLMDVTDHIRLWGEITDNVKASEEASAQFENQVEHLQERLMSVSQGPRVFHHTLGFWTPGRDTLTDEIYTILKANNIANIISGWTQMSLEMIVESDPEVVIAGSYEALEEFRDNSALQGVSAMKNNRVFVPKSDLLSVAGPRVAEGIEEMAKLLYPELFR